MMNRKFWNWVKNEKSRTLYFDGYIAQDSWFGDDITPKQFKSELNEVDGDITVWINSPGGDVFAASQIYNMLKEYEGNVTVKVDGIAASAASVIAMAGFEVQMSPVAMMMIHNPVTGIFGEATDFQNGVNMLSEVKEAIINAYEQKTSLPRNKISKMMDAETWFSAKKAVELGFADKVLYTEYNSNTEGNESFIFDRMTVVNSLMKKLPKVKLIENKKNGASHQELIKRLELIK